MPHHTAFSGTAPRFTARPTLPVAARPGRGRLLILGILLLLSGIMAAGNAARAQGDGEFLSPNPPRNTLESAPPSDIGLGATAPAHGPAPDSNSNSDSARPLIPGLRLETPDTGTAAAPATPPPEDIPQILLDEMAEMERYCNNNTYYAAYHDCRCVAIKFLDARMASSPETSRDRIFQSVSSECPNEEGIAGLVFQSCSDIMRNLRPNDFERFCTCTANDVATSYAARPSMNMRYIQDLRKRAMLRCGVANNPAINNSPYLNR